MPLQVLSQALGLPDPVVRAANPSWIYAESLNLDGITCLLVYQSVELRETDPDYAPVSNLLERSKTSKLIARETIADPAMMFGTGEWSVYLLSDGDEVSSDNPRVLTLLDVLTSFKDTGPVLPVDVPDEFLVRLRRVHERRGATL